MTRSQDAWNDFADELKRIGEKGEKPEFGTIAARGTSPAGFTNSPFRTITRSA